MRGSIVSVLTLRTITDQPTLCDVAEVADVYFAAFSAPPYGESPATRADLQERVIRYSKRPGFRLTLVTSAGGTAGMAMSVHAREGDWWRDRAAAALPAARAQDWLEGVVREVVHVAVCPEKQRCGIGTALVEDALKDPGATAVVLGCRPDALPAQQLYLRRGFQVLTEEFTTAAGQMPYWLMARRTDYSRLQGESRTAREPHGGRPQAPTPSC